MLWSNRVLYTIVQTENKIDHLSQKAFLNNIYKIGYSRKSIKKIDQKKYQVFLIKSFQRRFRQELVNGKIDRECLLISSNLIKRIY